MKIVMDIGGSVVCPEGVPDTGYLKKLKKIILSLAGKHRLVIVVGGGGLAKKMITCSEEAGAGDRDLKDWVGIMATRVNAGLLLAVLGKKAYPGIPGDVKEAAGALKSHRIVVMGGVRPRQTTDAVSVQAAGEIGARVIVIATNVKGVYTKNPLKYRDARFLERVSPGELVRIVEPCEFRPGHSGVLDPVAARGLAKTRIRTLVLDGRDLGNLERALRGDKFTGTTIE